MLARSHLHLASFAVILFCVTAAAHAATSKSARSIFNRTPATDLRELSTDRPDRTESPYTVDAGWGQIESDLVAYSRDHDKTDDADVQVTALSVASLNIKVGLTNQIDLQTVVETYTRIRVDDRMAQTRETVSGFGDITSRLKINLWGNDGGDSAFAVMPFVKWPTNQHGLGNDSVEGGLIVPYAREVAGWGMGVMTEIDLVRNGTDTGYTTDWVNTITFGRDLSDKVGMYVELATVLTRGADLASFDCGLTYGVSRDVQFDLGTNIGLTDATEDLTCFVGMSMRF